MGGDAGLPVEPVGDRLVAGRREVSSSGMPNQENAATPLADAAVGGRDDRDRPLPQVTGAVDEVVTIATAPSVSMQKS